MVIWSLGADCWLKNFGSDRKFILHRRHSPLVCTVGIVECGYGWIIVALKSKRSHPCLVINIVNRKFSGGCEETTLYVKIIDSYNDQRIYTFVHANFLDAIIFAHITGGVKYVFSAHAKLLLSGKTIIVIYSRENELTPQHVL